MEPLGSGGHRARDVAQAQEEPASLRYVERRL